MSSQKFCLCPTQIRSAERLKQRLSCAIGTSEKVEDHGMTTTINTNQSVAYQATRCTTRCTSNKIVINTSTHQPTLESWQYQATRTATTRTNICYEDDDCAWYSKSNYEHCNTTESYHGRKQIGNTLTKYSRAVNKMDTLMTRSKSQGRVLLEQTRCCLIQILKNFARVS